MCPPHPQELDAVKWLKFKDYSPKGEKAKRSLTLYLSVLSSYNDYKRFYVSNRLKEEKKKNKNRDSCERLLHLKSEIMCKPN